MPLRNLAVPAAVGAVIAGLIYAPAVVGLPRWTDACRIELISAIVLGAIVGVVSGPGNLRLFFGTISLFAALVVQASLSMWACGTPIVEEGYILTLIIGPGVFLMFPWLALLALLVDGAIAYAVLQRLRPAYRALAATVVLIGMTGGTTLLTAGPRLRPAPPSAASTCDAYFFFFDWFSSTAARMSALKAGSSIFSPSCKSIARRTLPSRLELKRRLGSFSEAPFANVSFTTAL
jgi:hypothetical protein